MRRSLGLLESGFAYCIAVDAKKLFLKFNVAPHQRYLQRWVGMLRELAGHVHNGNKESDVKL